MRVLIVSHNVFGKTNNMGKTLLSYFADFQPEEIAQFYIHSEVPTDDSVCRNYYRFTDKDAIRSLWPFRSYGKRFSRDEIRTDRASSATASGITGAMYQFGRKRTAGIFAARNTLWKLSRWNTKEFRAWVDEFSPDVIFYASGDYGFSYDIAREVADYTGKPLIVLCVDDFYLYNRNAHTLLGRLMHRLFMKTVHKTMERACEIYVISDAMKTVYEPLFGKPCRVLHTSAVGRTENRNEAADRISYIGNLENGRSDQLARMGQALKAMDAENLPERIDVYSGERNPEILKPLTEENGIRFHGMIPAEEVPDVMGRSMAVIHTESFDPEMAKLVRFSVSTKIAETLMYGPCLIAYGPTGIASIDYLKQHEAAYVISAPVQLEAGLKKILSDSALRNRIIENARELAKKNHNGENNSSQLRTWMENAAKL